ncbi:MAG TPA: hypothetical protein VJR89_18880 [Polyangiales bacterium]|nr:hypothetical protein [Polyangiales bacterium]
MIGKILASGQLGRLASFVTPAFFDVMPARALWNRGRMLLAGTRDREAFRHAVAARSAELAKLLPEVQLVDSASAKTRSNAESGNPEARAARVVELFFHQLFHGRVMLLDLRGASFTSQDEQHLLWHPAAWMAELSPEFLQSLREIYRGFYTRDDAMFRRGLSALSLQGCEDLFREHFGGAHVTFRTADFIETFHKIFQRCKEQGVMLHPDFLPLGIYLAALYDHVEDLAVAVDVAAAFERATRAALQDSEALHA